MAKKKAPTPVVKQLLDEDITSMESLAREMKAMRALLDVLPADIEYTPQAVDALDDVRYQALALAEMAKATLEEFGGKTGK